MAFAAGFACSNLNAPARRAACFRARDARPLGEVWSAASESPSRLNESSSVPSSDRLARCVATLRVKAINLVGQL